MKTFYLFAGILACLLVVPALGQTADELGLVVKPKNRTGNCSSFRNKLTCQNLALEFQNNGSSPVIIINPTLGFGTGLKEVLFSYTDRSGVSSMGKFVVEASSTASESFEALVRNFDGESPPENFTITLQPGETFPFMDFVVATIPVRNEPKRRYTTTDPETGEQRERWLPPTEHRPNGFRLVYEFSFLPYFADPNILEHLNVKWKKFGRMPEGVNGTYTVTSDLILCY